MKKIILCFFLMINYFLCAGDMVDYFPAQGVSVIMIDKNTFDFKELKSFGYKIYNQLLKLFSDNKYLITGFVSYFTIAIYLNDWVKKIIHNKFFQLLLCQKKEIDIIMAKGIWSGDDYLELLVLLQNMQKISLCADYMIPFAIMPSFFKELKTVVYNKNKIMNSISYIQDYLYFK